MIRFRKMHGILWALKGLAHLALRSRTGVYACPGSFIALRASSGTVLETCPTVALAALLVFVALAPLDASAQGSRKDDIVFNSRGTPLAGATVRVCTMPASGQPCTPLTLIYSDAGLTQALANPTTTDGLGNYFFYAAPGKYEIE